MLLSVQIRNVNILLTLFKKIGLTRNNFNVQDVISKCVQSAKNNGILIQNVTLDNLSL